MKSKKSKPAKKTKKNKKTALKPKAAARKAARLKKSPKPSVTNLWRDRSLNSQNEVVVGSALARELIQSNAKLSLDTVAAKYEIDINDLMASQISGEEKYDRITRLARGYRDRQQRIQNFYQHLHRTVESKSRRFTDDLQHLAQTAAKEIQKLSSLKRLTAQLQKELKRLGSLRKKF